MTENEKRQLALAELASLAIKKTDRRYTSANRELMQKRIAELVSRWRFTYQEVWDQMRKLSS